MGRTIAVGIAPFLTCVLAAQAAGEPSDAALRPRLPALPALPPPEVAIAGDGEFAIAACGLGDGGLGTAPRGELRWRQGGGCTTPGGVHVECRTAGVKLTFPSGRELLVAPDGHVHLRSGEHAGPFAMGLELWLADGTTVRIALAGAENERLRDVTVGDRERRLQPWRRGDPSQEVVRGGGWGGLRVLCCGDGGDLYRAVALGPLLVLDRALVAADRADAAPRERLVVLADAVVQSLRTMQRQHREPDPAVRRAMTGIGELAVRPDAWLPDGALLRRAERDALRWVCARGFELAIERTGPLAPRLQLFSGRSTVPIVEWTLLGDAAAFLINPRDDQTQKRWHGNGTRLPRVVPELQAREQLFERGLALQVLDRMLR
jgi:hypothetical protein